MDLAQMLCCYAMIRYDTLIFDFPLRTGSTSTLGLGLGYGDFGPGLDSKSTSIVGLLVARKVMTAARAESSSLRR